MSDPGGQTQVQSCFKIYQVCFVLLNVCLCEAESVSETTLRLVFLLYSWQVFLGQHGY